MEQALSSPQNRIQDGGWSRKRKPVPTAGVYWVGRAWGRPWTHRTQCLGPRVRPELLWGHWAGGTDQPTSPLREKLAATWEELVGCWPSGRLLALQAGVGERKGDIWAVRSSKLCPLRGWPVASMAGLRKPWPHKVRDP